MLLLTPQWLLPGRANVSEGSKSSLLDGGDRSVTAARRRRSSNNRALGTPSDYGRDTATPDFVMAIASLQSTADRFTVASPATLWGKAARIFPAAAAAVDVHVPELVLARVRQLAGEPQPVLAVLEPGKGRHVSLKPRPDFCAPPPLHTEDYAAGC